MQLDTSTKILFSESEAAAISDASFFLTKKNITEKVYQLFADEVNRIKKMLEDDDLGLPEELRLSVPKISRGENYKGLPYIISDYPAVFSKDDSFALRILFWWGNSFSVHLYLSGKYKLAYESYILTNIKNVENIFICINADPWKHEFEKVNYIPVAFLDKAIQELPFIKLGIESKLSDLENIPENISTACKKLLTLLKL